VCIVPACTLLVCLYSHFLFKYLHVYCMHCTCIVYCYMYVHVCTCMYMCIVLLVTMLLCCYVAMLLVAMLLWWVWCSCRLRGKCLGATPPSGITTPILLATRSNDIESQILEILFSKCIYIYIYIYNYMCIIVSSCAYYSLFVRIL